jgi:hypothetical protein
MLNNNYRRGNSGCLLSVGDSSETIRVLFDSRNRRWSTSWCSKFFLMWSNMRRSRNCNSGTASGWMPTWGRCRWVGDFLVLLADRLWRAMIPQVHKLLRVIYYLVACKDGDISLSLRIVSNRIYIMSIVQIPLRRTVSSWTQSASYLLLSKTEGRTNAILGETIFFGRFYVDEERDFTGAS